MPLGSIAHLGPWLRLQEARPIAETLGRLGSPRARPLLFDLPHPDAWEAVGFDRLRYWYRR